MPNLLIALALVVVGAIAGLGLAQWAADRPTATTVTVHASVESIRSVGELVVLKAFLKEIVTAKIDQSSAGWNLGTPKMAALIVTFDLAFAYNLKDPACTIVRTGDRVDLTLPKVRIDYAIKDVSWYHKQDGSWWGLGQPITTDEDNRLVAEAKRQAIAQASRFMDEYRAQYEGSATSLLGILAKGFGCTVGEIAFAR